MSEKCKKCGSYAINPRAHGRIECKDRDLCDVCYWRVRAEAARDSLKELVVEFERLKAKVDGK